MTRIPEQISKFLSEREKNSLSDVIDPSDLEGNDWIHEKHETVLTDTPKSKIRTQLASEITLDQLDDRYKGKVVSRSELDDQNIISTIEPSSNTQMDQFFSVDDEILNELEELDREDASFELIRDQSTRTASEAEKGKAVLKQTKLWTKLLELRIVMQKSVDDANNGNNIGDSSVIQSSFKSIGDLSHLLSPSLESFSDWESLEHSQSERDDYYFSVIDKWNAKTELSSGRLSKSTTLVSQQIQSAWSDLALLIERARGKSDADVYNDADFYHRLLKDLVEREVYDPKSPSTYNSKDRKSKGRKVDYSVHAKIVNFMAPLPLASDLEFPDKLFSSLFR